MTTIYILVCVGIFIFFSYEDINHLNPISSISEITDIKPRTINIKNEKIWLPFRIVTDENKYIDHRGILYIIPYYIEGKYNDKVGMELNYHLLNYKLCNETSMANNPEKFKIDVPLNELFCIEQDDILLGGNWNGNYINYIEINLYLCKEQIYFNESDSRCENIINLFKELNSSLSFDFYYPIVQFQPTNFGIPMAIIYKNYFYRLSGFSYKLEKLYLKEHILSDDRNILKSNYKNTSIWGMSSISGDDYCSKNENDPMIKNKRNEIYTLEIYLDYGLIYYTRTYNKLFIIISNTFPLFRFALYFIKKFTQHIKMSFTKRKLASLIFENKIRPKLSIIKIKDLNENIKQSIKITPKNNTSQNDLLKENNIINYTSINKNKMKYIKNKKYSLLKNNYSDTIINNKLFQNFNNKSNIALKNENVIKRFNEKDISLINASSDNNINRSLSRRNNYLFPYYYFLLDFFFDKLINPQQFCCLSKTYFTVYNFMCQIYDISTHIILFKQFNVVNNCIKKIYEENGFYPAYTFKKINIKDHNIIDKLNKDLKKKNSIILSKTLL